jgi:hypothetical protein
MKHINKNSELAAREDDGALERRVKFWARTG